MHTRSFIDCRYSEQNIHTALFACLVAMTSHCQVQHCCFYACKSSCAVYSRTVRNTLEGGPVKKNCEQSTRFCHGSLDNQFSMSKNSGTNAKTIVQHGQGSLDSKISALGQCAVHQDCLHHNLLLRTEDHETEK